MTRALSCHTISLPAVCTRTSCGAIFMVTSGFTLARTRHDTARVVSPVVRVMGPIM